MADYIRLRVDAQIDGYYTPKAMLYPRRVRRPRSIAGALGLLAAVSVENQGWMARWDKPAGGTPGEG